MKLALAILVLLALLSICSGKFTGACGGNLMDLFTKVCGHRPNGRESMSSRKYQNYYRKSIRRIMRSRSRRSVDSMNSVMIEQKRLSELSTRRAIRKAVGELPSFEVEHARIRRGITEDCCRNECSVLHIRRHYCPRIVRMLSN